MLEMDFSEGERVMARWPGGTRFFKARVKTVCEDDNEYVVQFETEHTLKAQDVKDLATSSSAGKATLRRRACCSGRSPERLSVETTTRQDSASRSTKRSRRSARNRHISADEDEQLGRKAIPDPIHSKKSRVHSLDSFFPPRAFYLEWVRALFHIVWDPLILISLHTLSQDGIFGIHSFAMPNFRLDWKEYCNQQALLAVFGFAFLVWILSYIPSGRSVRLFYGHEHWLNGYISLFLILEAIAVMAYREVDLSFVTKNYWHLMISSIALTYFVSVFAFVLARWGQGLVINPWGNTGNIIVDFFHGRDVYPLLAGNFLTLVTNRIAMIGLALINVLLVWDSIIVHKVVNYAILVTALFQVVHAADEMFFEEYYHMTTILRMRPGFGFHLAFSDLSHSPFMPTLITRYMIHKNPTLTTSQLLIICGVYVIGYLLFRISKWQQHEFRKNPDNPLVRDLDTVTTKSGEKILTGGFWGVVRHPDWVGWILMTWAWVLPAAVSAAGISDFLVYFVPIHTTFTLVYNCNEMNEEIRREYPQAWGEYSKKVHYDFIPYVY